MTKPAALSIKSYDTWVTALRFIVPILFFITLAIETRDQGSQVSSLDVRILNSIHTISTPALDRAMVHITNFGGIEVIIGATLVTALILYLLHRRKAVPILLIGVGGTAIINTALKLSFHRMRPSLWAPIITEKSFSFPSGHAMMSSALALSTVLLLWQTRWRWTAVTIGALYVVAIGFSRLYLGVHYPTDVLAGWTVSFIWILTVYTVITGHQHRIAASKIS